MNVRLAALSVVCLLVSGAGRVSATSAIAGTSAQRATAAPTAAREAPDASQATPTAERPWWGWLLLGRMHPMVVHFPIGLLTVAAVIEAVCVARRWPLPSDAATWCLALGLAGAGASVLLGTLNAAHQTVTGDAAVTLERHRMLGWMAVVAAAAALGAGQWARRRVHARTSLVYLALVFTTSAVVGATGHLGGEIVYGSEYLSGVLPWNQRAEGASTPAVPAATEGPMAVAPVVAHQAASVDFARDVRPIFEKTCVECHGPDKVKARLRMDSVEALQKGGKSGALLKAGDPENSLLMRRVLGLDGEDQMPLDKDPLTEAQIDTLRRWIAAGAPYGGGGSQ